MELRDRFYKTLKLLEVNWGHHEQLWLELDEKYCQSGRKYHNLNHLSELFTFFDIYTNQLRNPIEVAFAIFYHDIIYNIWSKNNELKSAELAKARLSNEAIESSSIDRIYNLIMVTKDHQPKENSDESWIVDFDLGILGQNWETYNKYRLQIREEYASVPEFMYKKGRKKVLNYFLNQPKIYQTKAFEDLFELNARENLKKELKLL